MRSTFTISVSVVSLLLVMAASAPAVDFYVSPTGSDASAGTLAQPFATITKAMTAVRAARSGGGDMNVYLRAGTYQITAPLTFSDQDGGVGSSKVTYQAYNSECVTISGGRRITGFTKGTGNMWTASIPEVKNGSWWFRELYVNGKRVYRSRFPNSDAGKENYQGKNDLPVTEVGAPGWSEADLVLLDFTLGGAAIPTVASTDVEAIAFHQFNIARAPVKTLEPHRLYTTVALGVCCNPEEDLSNTAEGNYIFLEHAKEFIDVPGEWYLERSTGTLYYLATATEDPNTETFIAPVSHQLVKANGTQTAPVKNLCFKGIIFEHSEWDLPAIAYDGNQAGRYGTSWGAGMHTVPSALEFVWTEGCRVEACCVRHTAESGIGFGAGCDSNRIIGCELVDLGGGGVDLGHQGSMPNGVIRWGGDWPNTAMVPVGNECSNCYVHKISQVYFDCVGIWTGNAAGSKITHNVVTDMPYTGISLGWQWNHNPSSMKNALIESNHVYNVVLRLADGGGTYSLGMQPGTVLRGNHIHDIPGNPLSAQFEAPNGGIYFDQGSEYAVSDNVVYKCQTAWWWGPNTNQSWITMSNNKVDAAATAQVIAAISQTAGLEAGYASLLDANRWCTGEVTSTDGPGFRPEAKKYSGPGRTNPSKVTVFDLKGRALRADAGRTRVGGICIQQSVAGGVRALTKMVNVK